LVNVILRELDDPKLVVTDEDQNFIDTLNPDHVLQRYIDLIIGAK